MAPASGVISLNSVTNTAVLAQAGTTILTAVRAIYPSMAADGYVQLFDAATAGAVTVGTTIPTWVVLNDFGSGEVTTGDGLPTDGLVFKLGIVVASTTTSTGSGSATQHVRIGVR